jgi:hypothetical protein
MTEKQRQPLEPEIKCAVIERLRGMCGVSPNFVIANEFVTDDWQRRADLLVVDKFLWAFEIKSAADRLDRLGGQVSAYLQRFDKVTVVVDAIHEAAALANVPTGVEVWVLQWGACGERYSWRTPQRGRRTPNTSIERLIPMLTARELRQLASEHQLPKGNGRRATLATAAHSLSPTKLREAVLGALATRYRKTSDEFWSAVGAQKVVPDHLALLSPFLALRQQETPLQAPDWTQLLQSFDCLLDEARKTFLPSGSDENTIFRDWSRSPPEASPFGPVPPDIQARLIAIA